MSSYFLNMSEPYLVPLNKRVGNLESRMDSVEKDVVALHSRVNRASSNPSVKKTLTRKPLRIKRESSDLSSLTGSSPSKSVEELPRAELPVPPSDAKQTPVWYPLNNYLSSIKLEGGGVLSAKSEVSKSLRSHVFRRNREKTAKAKTLVTHDGKDSLKAALDKLIDSLSLLYKYHLELTDGKTPPTDQQRDLLTHYKETLKVCNKLTGTVLNSSTSSINK